jgi:hypothetical protein
VLQSQRYVATRNWAPILGHVVTSAESKVLATCLAQDATALTNAAAISIVDAIRGLQSQFFTWATVKLYYSIFYSFRAILADSRVGVLYEGAKPRIVHAAAGVACAKADGTTHKVVMNEFAKTLSTHWLLSQEIALKSPPEWFIRLREEANYGGAFSEPDCPRHFEALLSSGVRRSVTAYLGDRLLAFDEDHAALAYPLHALVEARSRVLPMEEEAADFIRTRAKDPSGPLAELIGQLTG